MAHNGGVRTSLGPLAVQRLLVAGLACTVALCGFLLWMLRSRDPRGRGPQAAAASATIARTAEPERPSSVSAPRTSTDASEHTREVAPETPGLARADGPEEAFDPGAIRGRVLCEGKAVPDVELRLFDASLERRERRAPLSETKSDAEGRFRFRGLEPYARHVLQAQREDYLPREETLYPGHAEELELERAAEVSGKVLDAASRQPLSGIEIALERWNFGAEGMRERVSALSDAHGGWRLPWAKPGMESFTVLRPGHVPERHEFQVVAEGSSGYEILLGDKRVVELELYALESGAPLAGTEVLCDGVLAKSDARGHLAVPLAPSGVVEETLRLTLALPDGCSTQLRVGPSQPGGLLRVPLTRGGSVRGRVLDAHGAPVSGAQVRLAGGGRAPSNLGLPEGFWLNPARNPARSGADGSFHLAGLPPRDGPVELRASHPEHPPGRSEPFAFARLGQEVTLEIRLAQGGTVTGQVRLDGAPAPLRVFWESAEGNGWTRANDRGDYRIVGVPSGELALRARLDEEDEDVPRAEDQEVWIEEATETVADFELSSRRALIRGRVLDTSGAPVADAEISAWPSVEDDEWMGEQPEAECAADGSFALSVPDTPGLAFDLTAESGPRRARVREVRAGGPELELVLPALVPVSLRVVDALRHEPVLGFQIYWRDSDDGEFVRLAQGGRRFSPGPDGTFLAELPAGRLDLVVAARQQGFVPARRDGVELGPAGEPATLEFELDLGVELELALTPPPSGDLLRHLQRGRIVFIHDDQWADRKRGGDYYQQEARNPQTLRVDGNGVARLKAMPSGSYRFTGGPPGMVFRPARLEVPAVTHHRLEVAVELQPVQKPPDSDD